MSCRVVLVDAPEARRVVRTALVLRGGFEVVGEAGDGARAVGLAADLQPDVVLLGPALPDIAGRELLAQVRRHSPGSKVVVLSPGEPASHAWAAGRVDGHAVEDAGLDALLDLLEQVGREGGDVAVLPLAQELGSARLARELVREVFERWQVRTPLDEALVVVSEMVTNAVTHAHSACELRLLRRPGAVRVEVLDGGAGTPDLQAPSTTSEHGRGLHLIAALALAWGLEVVPEGKLVWADLAVEPGAGAADADRLPG